jgi:hypothetical protein
MPVSFLHLYVATKIRVHDAGEAVWDRLVVDESGEGVISAAIAVLIMAFLGALMWIGFRTIWSGAEADITTKVGEIGS